MLYQTHHINLLFVIVNLFQLGTQIGQYFLDLLYALIQLPLFVLHYLLPLLIFLHKCHFLIFFVLQNIVQSFLLRLLILLHLNESGLLSLVFSQLTFHPLILVIFWQVQLQSQVSFVHSLCLLLRRIPLLFLFILSPLLLLLPSVSYFREVTLNFFNTLHNTINNIFLTT